MAAGVVVRRQQQQDPEDFRQDLYDSEEEPPWDDDADMDFNPARKGKRSCDLGWHWRESI